MSEASVEIKDLVKTYLDDRGRPTFTAVKGINLNIEDGEFMVLVGPSGCGKSTTLRMIAGLERVTGGTISIGGRVVNNLEPKERGIAMVFQSYALYPHMSIFKNMAFGLELAKKTKEFISDMVGKTAKALQLDHMMERKPRQYCWPFFRNRSALLSRRPLLSRCRSRHLSRGGRHLLVLTGICLSATLEHRVSPPARTRRSASLERRKGPSTQSIAHPRGPCHRRLTSQYLRGPAA